MNVNEIITDKVIKSLEKGRIPWQKTWKNAIPAMSFHTKKPYRGINAVLLSLTDAATPYYLTFKQIQDLGGSVKAGAKSEMVVFWNWMEKTTDEGKIKRTPFLRYYNVFNLAQTTGIEYQNPYEVRTDINPCGKAEAIMAGFMHSPRIEFVAGRQPSYCPATDVIRMPLVKSFTTDTAYYATLFHEAVHGSGHASRLNREGVAGRIEFGSEKYSKEELIAEMGAAFLCGQCDIGEEVFDNSVAYIQGWLKVLKDDPRFIISAAAQAQKAVDWIFMTPTPANEEAPEEEKATV